jgi:hypothetical protein
MNGLNIRGVEDVLAYTTRARPGSHLEAAHTVAEYLMPIATGDPKVILGEGDAEYLTGECTKHLRNAAVHEAATMMDACILGELARGLRV